MSSMEGVALPSPIMRNFRLNNSHRAWLVTWGRSVSRPPARMARGNGNAHVNDTMALACDGQGCGGTTDADLRTALRFVLGRPGWRVEVGATEQGGACLGLTTPCPDTGGQRRWRLLRTQQGLLVHDEASGRRLWFGPSMRDALVEVWEAVTVAAPD